MILRNANEKGDAQMQLSDFLFGGIVGFLVCWFFFARPIIQKALGRRRLYPCKESDVECFARKLYEMQQSNLGWGHYLNWNILKEKEKEELYLLAQSILQRYAVYVS